MLKGHERAITCVVYNNDGDLVFTAAKDQIPTLWYAKTGERIGTYQGHQGAVWDLAVSCKSSSAFRGYSRVCQRGRRGVRPGGGAVCVRARCAQRWGFDFRRRRRRESGVIYLPAVRFAVCVKCTFPGFRERLL